MSEAQKVFNLNTFGQVSAQEIETVNPKNIYTEPDV